MRKVTELTVKALINGMNRTVGNTSVEYNTDKDRYELKLHGNLIAYRTCGVQRMYISNAGWHTNTTKERINGIIDIFCRNTGRVYQRDFEWFYTVNDEKREFPCSEFVEVN